MAKLTAVIDIGSNSMRMAIFKRSSQFGFALIHEQKSKVRISEGSYENSGNLQPKVMQRALEVLESFYHIAKIYRARKILTVATSALRDAPNSKEFLSQARKRGIFIKIISGEKESYFGAIAVSNLLHKKDGIMVDIGGGSSEIALIRDSKIVDCISLNIGVVRLKELFLDKDKDPRDFILQVLESIPKSFQSEYVFGVGGSIRSLAKLIVKQDERNLAFLHGFEFSFKEHSDFIAKIIKAKRDKLLEMGISSERADSIQAGLIIFSMLLERFGAKSVISCGVGIREGVFLHDMLRTHKGTFPNSINPSLRYIQDIFTDRLSLKRKELAREIFSLVQAEFVIKEYYKNLFYIACILCDVGIWIDFYTANNHASYLALNMLRYRFSHKERVIISLLLKFSDKKRPKDSDLERFKMSLNFEVLQILSFFVSVIKIIQLSQKKLEFTLKNNTFIIHGALESCFLKERLSKLITPKNISLAFE